MAAKAIHPNRLPEALESVAHPGLDPASSQEFPLETLHNSVSLRTQAEATSVSCMMSRGVVCLAADTPLTRVTDLLLERDIGSAPVIDAAWRPIGMISKTDLLRVYAISADRSVALPQTVGDIVAPLILSLHEESPVSVAAALMAYEGVHRLPIVASSGEVVGVVSTLDIVRWVARCTHDEVLLDGG